MKKLLFIIIAAIIITKILKENEGPDLQDQPAKTKINNNQNPENTAEQIESERKQKEKSALSVEAEKTAHQIENSRIEKEKNALRVEAENANYAATKIIKRFLKSPSTAKFSNPYFDSGTGPRKADDGSYYVSGFVDAKNSFGAELRQEWIVHFRKNNDTWEPVFVSLGNTVLINNEEK